MVGLVVQWQTDKHWAPKIAIKSNWKV